MDIPLTQPDTLASENNAPETISNKAPPKTRKKLKRWVRKLSFLLIKLIVIFLICITVWTWVGRVHINHNNNMYPHLKDGDLVITYMLEDYFREDVVMYETSKGIRLGRIVARGGDLVELQEDGYFAINGNTPYEDLFYETYPVEQSEIEFPYVVPEGEVFVLNDMREMNSDSRTLGAIPESSLLGKVKIVLRHRGV